MTKAAPLRVSKSRQSYYMIYARAEQDACFIRPYGFPQYKEAILREG